MSVAFGLGRKRLWLKIKQSAQVVDHSPPLGREKDKQLVSLGFFNVPAAASHSVKPDRETIMPGGEADVAGYSGAEPLGSCLLFPHLVLVIAAQRR
jgi:hypothetical protein